MIVKGLQIKNFRNIKTADFLFSDKTNIISGSNAQGKTNLMEAISTAIEKSFRTQKTSELISNSESNEGINERLNNNVHTISNSEKTSSGIKLSFFRTNIPIRKI